MRGGVGEKKRRRSGREDEKEWTRGGVNDKSQWRSGQEEP